VETDHLGTPRHVFAAGTVIQSGEALVVFGGGSPSEALEETPGAPFLVAEPDDPAWSNGLNMDDEGDVLRLLGPDLRRVFTFSWGNACAGDGCHPAVSDRSLTRSPDIDGAFTPHDEAAGPDGAVFSPGTRLDGTPFDA